MTWCVYAVTTAPPPPLRVRGAADERLTRVTAGHLAAIVGRLPRAPAPTRANLHRYHALQMRLFERLTAVLPARFGTSVADMEEVRFVLDSRQSPLREALRLVRGRAQMTVRIVVARGGEDSGAATAAQPRGDHASPAGSGLEYLRARAAAAARARRVPEFEPFRSSVQRWVRAERVERRADVLTIYHLVPRGSAAAYRQALERAGARAGVSLLVTGPFPAFAFADAAHAGG